MRFRRFPPAVAIGMLSLCLCLSNAGFAQAAGLLPAPHDQRSPLVIVKNYFDVLDADLKTGQFASLGTAYASNAVLKVMDVHGIATEYRGLSAIINYWEHRGRQVPGLHFTADRIVSLDRLHVAAFERTINNAHTVLAGRCAHLFKVTAGKIVFDAYFGIAYTESERAHQQ